MSGSRPVPGERPVADQHLGDRLSALVDGELGHDTRERVLAHLATCAKCKAEADAQRQLKNVFAEAAPPSPSESFLARLQGLPAHGGLDDGGPASGGGGFGRRPPGTGGRAGLPRGPRVAGGSGVFGVRGEPFGYVPSGPHTGVLSRSEERGLFSARELPGDGGTSGGRGFLGDRGALGKRGLFGDRDPVGNGELAGTGRRRPVDAAEAAETAEAVDGRITGDRVFRIHQIGRHDTERSASRGLRFAFVAAGAVSLAAIALGGMSTGVSGDTPEARGGSGSGSNATPMRMPGPSAPTAAESQRRSGFLRPLLGQGLRPTGHTPVASTASAPLLPEVPAPAGQGQTAAHPLTAPVLAGAAAMSPLIPPLSVTPPVLSASWPMTPGLTAPGLLLAPAATSSPAPTLPAIR